MSDEITDAAKPATELDTKTTVIPLKKPRVKTDDAPDGAIPKMQPAASQTIKLTPASAAQGTPAPIKLTPVTAAAGAKPKATIKLTPSAPAPSAQNAPATLKLTPVAPAGNAKANATIKLTPAAPAPSAQNAPATIKLTPATEGVKPNATIKLTPAMEGVKPNATIKLKPQQPSQPTPAPAALKLTPTPDAEDADVTNTVKLKARPAPAADSKAAGQTIKLTPASGTSTPGQTIKLTPPAPAQQDEQSGMKTMKLSLKGAEKSAGKTISLKAVQPHADANAEPGGFVPSFAADALKDKADDKKYEPGVAFMIMAIASVLILAFSAFVMFAQYMNMYEGKDIDVPWLERLVTPGK